MFSRFPSSLAPAITAWAFALGLVGLAAPPVSAQDASPSPVAAEFDAICQRELATSEFFGEGLRKTLEAQLSPSGDTPHDYGVRVAMAADALRLGNFSRAHQEIDKALAVLASFPEDRRAPEKARVLVLQGMAHFLAAEDANCLEFNNAASCILPIQPEAVHRNQEPIGRAIKSFTEVVDLDPQDPEALWLLNLSHMLAGTYPDEVPEEFLIPPQRFGLEHATSASESTPGAENNQDELPRMLNVGPALGIDVMDLAGGGIADDFDGDGYIDLISSSWDPCSSMRAFRSNGKDGFEDVTEAWGLNEQLGGLNLVHADVNNDGALDILVLRGAWGGRRGQIRNSLLLNSIQKTGKFEDITYKAGLAHPAYPTQAAAFADYDLDGDLDLYVGNESSSSSPDFLNFEVGSSRPYPAQLFENQGERDGVPVFRDVARSAGVQNLSFAKGVAWGDIDNDGDEDLFVANLGPNRLYINLGNGRFEDRAAQWRVDATARNFVAWFFDFDNDGDLDLFNGDYSVPPAAVAASLIGKDIAVGHPHLFRNDGAFMTDIYEQAGMAQPLLPMGANFGDVDGDGYEDIYIGTGLPAFTAVLPNVFFHNRQGKTFEEATYSTGLGHLQKGHAVAFADLDHDGDLDLFEQLGGAYPYDRFGNALYLNPANDRKFDKPARHRFLTLELVGTKSNRFAIGARVSIRYQEPDGIKTIERVVSSGGSFGGSSLRLELGLGQATAIESVSIRWPGSTTAKTILGSSLQLDSFYRVTQAATVEQPDEVKQFSVERINFKPKAPSSSDTSNHEHHRP